jgi:ribose transport system substrate-binding protein
MRYNFLKGTVAALAISAALAGAVMAEDVFLMDGVTPSTTDTTVVPADAFKKDGPWVIGMSHFGVNANT